MDDRALEQGKLVSKGKPHVWERRKALSWPVCRCCGLLLLKNEATAQAARKPCPDNE